MSHLTVYEAVEFFNSILYNRNASLSMRELPETLNLVEELFSAHILRRIFKGEPSRHDTPPATIPIPRSSPSTLQLSH